ncbi:MAG: type II secretion system protein, partial [Christensenellaceae bacterium]
MAKKAKKAFTIVELVIVIAVVAILMAVLIPTFVSLVKKANVSSDTQLVRNLNTILTAEGVTEGKNPTMHDALEDAFENGYDITKISPTSEGNDIVWDSKNDRFALVHINESGTMETIYSDSATSLSTGV